MRFTIENWEIKDIISQHQKSNLNLNPPYQRNDIWTEKSQMELISSIKQGMPIPNFFFHKRQNGKYDIADGQQRTRAILAYFRKEITDSKKVYFNGENDFLSYIIPIIVINEEVSEAEIRMFYVKVNNTGLRLNKPELTKAANFDSKMLTLIEELCELDPFKKLGIFSEKQEDRMIDREFVEELVAQIIYGISDKKNIIKRLYKENVNKPDDFIENIRTTFSKVIDICFSLNNTIELSKTRYSQKNDFYTLFGFILNNISISLDSFNKFYSLLVKIQDDISPSNEKCEPLQYYAYRCVSQSNSKNAREDRLLFFNSLLLNRASKPNKLQKVLIKYYKLNDSDLITVESFLTLKPDNINTNFSEE